MALRYKKKSSFVKRLLYATLFLIVGWGAGLFYFAASIPLKVNNPDQITDAIVVLTGGSMRLETGLALLDRNRADKLFVSGVYNGVDVAMLLQISKRDPETLEGRISIGNAVDTIENAAETKRWVDAVNARSIRLVTAAYHMPRSLLEFKNMMPDTRIIPHPVFPGNVKHTRWWAWPGTANLMIREYNKYLLAWIRVHFIPWISK